MPKTDLLQGTLDLLILKILTLGPNHGWGISNRIRQISRDALNASQGGPPSFGDRKCQLGPVRDFGEQNSERRMRRLIEYLRGLARRREIGVELEDELRFHLEQQIETNVRRGMSSR